jgi:transcriptional regulator with XRE-family HTH domain
MTVGDYIKRKIEETGLSAGEVAERSEGAVSENYIRKIMRGETRNPSIPKLKAIAKGFGIDEQELLSEAGVSSDNPWPPKLLIKALARITDSPALTELVKKLIEMDETETERVLKFLAKKKK